MDNLNLVGVLRATSYFSRKLSELKNVNKTSFLGLVGSSSSLILSALAEDFPHLLVVTSSLKEAERVQEEIKIFSQRPAQIFPPLDALPHEEAQPSRELIGQRLKVKNSWQVESKTITIAPLRAVMQRTSQRCEKINLTLNHQIDREVFISKLVAFGYKRFELVGERGEFSVRGAVIDVFPSHQDFPVRIEFVGDQITSLRLFDPYSQRSTEKITEILILPVLEKEEVPVFDLLPSKTLVILVEPLELIRLAESLQEESKNYLGFDKVENRAQVKLSSFLLPEEEVFFSAPSSYLGELEKIPSSALIISRHAARLKEEFPELKVKEGSLAKGFVFAGIEVLTDYELFGEEVVLRKKPVLVPEGVSEKLLVDLKEGDYVVHENYGIGIYRGMKELEIEGIKQEYLLIEYAEGDKLYVPPHMVGLVEKYQAVGKAKPRLSRLGTKQWLHTRQRVKESVQELTKELLGLYAFRQKVEGFAFPPDDLWQKELEATFPYEETPDQAKAIFEVKKDMESPRPMDRLICGDVGYGKTEVAIRAAAKAISSGKQVAFLAPTTILVEQHYSTFKQRFQNFPFVIEMLSRFRSKKEQKKVLKLLESGGVDLVIGTHRLLSKDVKFKDLGLLIIDEEQKFGVRHKEKLKQLKKNIDVLTLTATPIPRTLYFSLSGVREMSLIATPPVDRSPIRTYVLPFSEKVIREAILRELDRGGQVYFVHNYVETIEGIAVKIRKLVPEGKVAVAHGQMEEKKLEKTMLDFLGRKFDILVCTAIIESGLDIPNVNTILIDRADRFGLSQLYQMRGRVGRSAVRAYAYLFYHPARRMTDEAVERLKAMQEFTALGCKNLRLWARAIVWR